MNYIYLVFIKITTVLKFECANLFKLGKLMKLKQLLQNTSLVFENPDLDINGLTSDSREVKSGFLFAALDNGITNGNQFIPQAIQAGAGVILSQCKPQNTPDDVLFLISKNPNKDFGIMLKNFYQSQPQNLAAITGTNGKTSIADFVRQMIFALGQNAASMGTLGLIKNDQAPIPFNNTTPGAMIIHKTLDELKQAGFDYLIMETSSHGICQYRISGVDFKVAGFTNLTQDHLDFHKTMKNYYEAKKLLFTDIMPKGGTAVLNADIQVFDDLQKACLDAGHKVISYGHNGKDIQVLQEEPCANGQNIKIKYFGKIYDLFVPLAGDFQVMNVLCALGIASALTGKKEELLALVPKIKGAKGRLQYIGTTSKGGAVYVDYAHTPDAIENILTAMRSHTKNKLHILFGCGGDRDKTKRPIMGKIAQKLADFVYVADDNPRTENPENIRQEIMQGCPQALNLGDREKAIAYAMNKLEKGDILLVAGKGHETGQYINGKILPFNDQEVVEKYL